MKERRFKIAQILFVLPFLAVLFYQNCSKVEFSPSTLDQSSQTAADTPLVIGTAQVKVGARNVPPLKLFFIVDNSYTMKQNQLNLSQSFEKMFAANNAKSLANFDTTAFLINTAQQVPDSGANDIKTILNEQLNTTNISSAALSQARTATTNSGAVAGDIVGFKIDSSINSRIQFLPAPVLGFKPSGNGFTGTEGIHKLSVDDPSTLSQEFQSRLELMDSGRIPLIASGQKYNAILDGESGLCAMARILRNRNGFINSGEQAAFIIVSDEDEDEVSGKKCIQSYTNVTSADDLIKGRCEERSSTLAYTINQNGIDSCKLNYQTGYKYDFQWTQDSEFTKISYRKLSSSGSYSTPRTKISYSKISYTYQNLETNVTYFIKSCTPVISDGIKVGENCTYPKKSGTLAGDWTNKCAQGASQLNSSALTSDNSYPVSCAKQLVTVGSCTNNDPNCTSTPSTTASSSVVYGTHSNQTDCTIQGKSIPGAVAPFTCSVYSAKTGTGACPASLAQYGCKELTNPSYAVIEAQVAGNFTTSTSTCYNKASTLPGAAIDNGANSPSCTLINIPESKQSSGTLSFSSSADSGNTVSLGNCGSLTSAILAQVKSGNPLATSNGSCTLTSYASASQSNVAIGNSDCATLANAKCSGSQSALRACTGQVITGSSTPIETKLPTLTSDVNCSDLCSKQSQLCAAAPGVTITPATKIEDYLKMRYGAGTTCSVEKTQKTVANFVDQLEKDMPSLCIGTPSTPQYLVQNGNSYRLNDLVIDHVAGTMKSGSNYLPGENLLDYIDKQSAQVFSSQTPMVSVFVRTPEDGTGNGGSIGVTYDQLARRMGGSVERVTSPDYSSALTNLSDIIRDRLERSFIVPGMQANQKVRSVWHRASSSGPWVPVNSTLWTTSGSSVTLASSVTLNLDDELMFEFF